MMQEAKWRDQHLEEGIEYLRMGNNETAIECFNIARKFDNGNPEIYIAKAIALYNIVIINVNRKIRLKL